MNLLKKVESLEHVADEFGFRWEHAGQIMAQIESECLEITEHLHDDSNKQLLQEEIGDLLHAVFSLCVFCKFSPEETLQQALDKFEKRLNCVKDLARKKGLSNLNGFSFDKLMALWNEAKQLENGS